MAWTSAPGVSHQPPTPVPTGAGGMTEAQIRNSWMLLFGSIIPMSLSVWCIHRFYIMRKHERWRSVQNLNLHLVCFTCSTITCLLAAVISAIVLSGQMTIPVCDDLGYMLAVMFYYTAWVQTFTYVHMTMYLGWHVDDIRLRRTAICVVVFPAVIALTRFFCVLSQRHNMKMRPEGFCTVSGDHNHAGVLAMNVVSVLSTTVAGTFAYYKVGMAMRCHPEPTYAATLKRMYVFGGFAVFTVCMCIYRIVDGYDGTRGAAWDDIQSLVCFVNFSLLFLPLPISFLVGELSVPKDEEQQPILGHQTDSFASSKREARAWRFSEFLDQLLPGSASRHVVDVESQDFSARTFLSETEYD